MNEGQEFIFGDYLTPSSIINNIDKLELKANDSLSYEILGYVMINFGAEGSIHTYVRHKRSDGLFYFKEGSINQTPCYEPEISEHPIYSVKRCSDGQVFTIGDIVCLESKKDSLSMIRCFKKYNGSIFIYFTDDSPIEATTLYNAKMVAAKNN